MPPTPVSEARAMSPCTSAPSPASSSAPIRGAASCNARRGTSCPRRWRARRRTCATASTMTATARRTRAASAPRPGLRVSTQTATDTRTTSTTVRMSRTPASRTSMPTRKATPAIPMRTATVSMTPKTTARALCWRPRMMGTRTALALRSPTPKTARGAAACCPTRTRPTPTSRTPLATRSETPAIPTTTRTACPMSTRTGRRGTANPWTLRSILAGPIPATASTKTATPRLTKTSSAPSVAKGPVRPQRPATPA